MKVPNLKLADGNTIPQVALGTWQNTDEAEFRTAFEAAIKAGYRHFDTAQAYGNEQYLGNAWQRSGLKRAELFITTKIAVQHFGYSKAKQTFAESLQKLQTDNVNLLLLHFPVPVLRKKTWQALEEIQAEGTAHSIGVSNYTIRHLREMETYAKGKPAVNQVELHVFLQQPELVKYCQENDIVIEAYSPLARGRVMDNPAILQIAQKHHKSYAQIMLRWLVEQGFVILPKSVTPSRIQENIDLFDFKLDTDDLKLLAAQDQDLRTCWSPVHVP
jgi:diketogulonate reductase-like aldo/keto reductase